MSLTISEIEELEGILEIRHNLPHLYGFPWYQWAYDFFKSHNKHTFLCAGNQLSKSSSQIRKVIDWATDPTKWKELWPGLLPGQKPNQFWYLYPTQDVWQAEFETKWEPDFLPRGKMKEHPQYGWKANYDLKRIKKIEFNSGVTIYCKSYAQKAKDLQTGSVYMLCFDEETPDLLVPELLARIRATNGYLSAVMTPTIGQEYWRKVFEPASKDEELFPNAWKRTVSLFDCQEYMDKNPSRWTDDRIREVMHECATDNEIQRRVFGRFVKSEGLRFPSFDVTKNTKKAEPIPKSWTIYGGVDPGSGGKSGHPAAMGFIAVRPDYKYGRVFRAWRGDGIPTANPDILQKFKELKKGLTLVRQVYDYKDKDFYLVAESQGEPFEMANKRHDEGFGIVNSLFKNQMLDIDRGDPELEKLITELLTLPVSKDKRKLKDDLCDFLRYTSLSIPWDFSDVRAPAEDNDLSYSDPPPDTRTDEDKAVEQLLKSRRDFANNKEPRLNEEDEFDFWNYLSGAEF